MELGGVDVIAFSAGVGLSRENINLVSQFAYYPWNINNKVISCYRNAQIRSICFIPVKRCRKQLKRYTARSALA